MRRKTHFKNKREETLLSKKKKKSFQIAIKKQLLFDYCTFWTVRICKRPDSMGLKAWRVLKEDKKNIHSSATTTGSCTKDQIQDIVQTMNSKSVFFYSFKKRNQTQKTLFMKMAQPRGKSTIRQHHGSACKNLCTSLLTDIILPFQLISPSKTNPK